MIVQENLLLLQNSYIHILADSLASFDYAQIEQIVNESRQAQRQNRMEGISRPTSITMPVTKQLSAIMRAEAHLLYRMMESPLVLNDYRLGKTLHLTHLNFRSYMTCLASMEIFLRKF